MTKPTKQTRPPLYFRVEYHRRVSNPFLWIEKAYELISAAETLEPSINAYWNSLRIEPDRGLVSETSETEGKELLQAPYFMMMAFALENYFKAILVADNDYSGELLIAGKLPVILKNHDLVKLAEITGLALGDVELSLLTRLSVNSIWQGRYPAPANCVELNNMPIRQGKSIFTAYLSPMDIRNLHTLTKRLKKYVTLKVASMDKERLS
jgi:hypothetical protein